ncbi:MAG: TetR/AcrR family transcriptional regulator [Bacteroidales bacterium]|nr:TetR/AcrR family transcriptional regulator [Bacteroidales bacterium]
MLFWKFGTSRVTVEEICREAGVSKMTFYKYFPNKLELACTILDEVFEESIKKIHQLRDNKDPAPQKLKRILQLKSEGVQGLGEEFIKDLYSNPDSDLKPYMEQKTGSMLVEIKSVFEKGKQDGWVRKDVNISFLFSFIMAIQGIITDEEMLKKFQSPEALIMEITNLIVYGISPHDE